MTSLRAMVNKAKMMEESPNDMKADKDSQKVALGKRSFGSFANKNYEAGGSSSSGFNKRSNNGKQLQQDQSQEKSQPSSNAPGHKRCGRCLGPHAFQDCK